MARELALSHEGERTIREAVRERLSSPHEEIFVTGEYGQLRVCLAEIDALRNLSLCTMQEEVREWAQRNFPNEVEHHLVMGMTEELGELAHAVLKREMCIRTNEDHDAAVRDAVGDLCVFLMEFCNLNNIVLDECVRSVWDQVRRRDWKRNAVDGSVPE